MQTGMTPERAYDSRRALGVRKKFTVEVLLKIQPKNLVASVVEKGVESRLRYVFAAKLQSNDR
jgi:hypothetical protein